MKDKLYKKAIAWAKKRGFENIKANVEDLEQPRSFSRPGSDEVIIPDLTGTRTGNKSYIQIALKEDDKQEVISKWKLFGTLAARKGGKLYLLAARGHKSFTERIVDKYDLPNATVVSI
jgi:hypothetical protein